MQPDSLIETRALRPVWLTPAVLRDLAEGGWCISAEAFLVFVRPHRPEPSLSLATVPDPQFLPTEASHET